MRMRKGSMKDQKIISLNPGKNYAVIGEVTVSTNAEIDAKIAAARAAQPAWAKLGCQKRVELLNKLYDAFAHKRNELASLISQEMGMPVAIANQIDVGFGLQYMRGYLDDAPGGLRRMSCLKIAVKFIRSFLNPKVLPALAFPGITLFVILSGGSCKIWWWAIR